MGDNPRLRNAVMFLLLLRVVAPNMNSDKNPYTVVTDKTERVSNSVVAYHVTSVYPTRYLNAHAKETKDMKFNVLNIE